ncbi:MAG: gliding motility protein GldN [Bacteroidota bacterium]
MQKKWMICFLISGIALLMNAQTTDDSDFPTTRSWLDGGGQDHFVSSPPLPYAPVREADILWEKRVWRVIDTREKMNMALRSPGNSLFEAIEQGLEQGAINAYAPQSDRFTEPVSTNDVWASLNQVDTVWVIDPVTGDYQQQIVTSEFDPDRIKRWRVQEVWYQDTRYSTMQVRIIGIAPLIETVTENEQASYETPIFWINYAEARPWLAQYAVASSENDANRMSWEDLFSMRRFSSYVYQESDMLGRRLKDYLAGEDLLQHSRKIDRTIQNREMDMWSY